MQFLLFFLCIDWSGYDFGGFGGFSGFEDSHGFESNHFVDGGWDDKK